jgi:hypothetical protein
LDVKSNVMHRTISITLPRQRPHADPLIQEAHDRHRRRRRRLLLLVALVLAVAVAAYGGFHWRGSGPGTAPSGSAGARPAGLPHQPGWYVGEARVATPGCARCVQTASWASTIPYLDKPNDFPQRTMTALRARDAIVLVTRSWQPARPRWMSQRHPLRIVRALIDAGFEGNPTHERVSEWLGASWRAGSFVSVYVFFGSPTPLARDVARAERELAGTTFPIWSLGR